MKEISVSQVAYAAIRETDGKLWIDTCTITLSIEQTKKFAEDSNRAIPHWGESNPVKFFQQVDIKAQIYMP